MKQNLVKFLDATEGFLESIFGAGPWPQWVRDLDGKSGVYLIKSKETGRVLYIGESHTGRLKKTLLHHFQSWSGPTSGPTYSRGDVQIGIVTTKPANAVEVQNRLINRHKPRDNKADNPTFKKNEERDENPF